MMKKDSVALVLRTLTENPSWVSQALSAAKVDCTTDDLLLYASVRDAVIDALKFVSREEFSRTMPGDPGRMAARAPTGTYWVCVLHWGDDPGYAVTQHTIPSLSLSLAN